MPIQKNQAASRTRWPPSIGIVVFVFMALPAGAAISACGTTKTADRPGHTASRDSSSAGDGRDAFRRTDSKQRQAHAGRGQANIPLRHIRLGGFLGRQASAARGHCGPEAGRRRARCEPQDGTQPGAQGRCLAWPADSVASIKAGRVDMDDPASTVALLKANAVVGVTAFLNPDGSAKSVGIQCALCHSTVDDSFSPGIGEADYGRGNRDLNTGAICDHPEPPAVQPARLRGRGCSQSVLNSWGPGRYDARN